MTHWQFNIYVVLLLLTVGIASAVAVYAWRHRATTGAVSFAILMMAVAEWCLAYGLRMASADPPAILFWSKARYLGIAVVPVAWLAFGLQYTGSVKWLTPRNLVFLSIEPVAIVLLAWTNEYHWLLWSDVDLVTTGHGLMWVVTHGPAFWVHTVYSYVLLLIGSFSLLRSLVRSPRLYRGQAGALLLGAIVPLLGNIVYALRLSSLDLTPFGFAISGLVVTWGLFRFRLLDIVPVARDAVVEGIGDGVLVLDTQDRIVDLNRAAQQIIRRSISDVVGQPFGVVWSVHPEVLECYRSMVASGHEGAARCEVALRFGSRGGAQASENPEDQQRDYELSVSLLHSRRDRAVGRLLMFRDVTDRKRTEQAVQTQKQLFESLVTLARATAEHPTLEATLQGALGVAASLTGAEYGTLFLLGKDGTVTHNLLMHGVEPEKQPPEVIERVMRDGLAGWVARNRQPVLIDDTRSDPRWLYLAEIPSATTLSALAVPIMDGPELRGLLTLSHSQAGHFGEDNLRFVQAAADYMTLTLRNARMFEMQRQMVERQTTLYQVLRAVAGQLSPGAVIKAAVESIAEFASWSDVAVAVVSEDQSHWEILAAGGGLSGALGVRHPVGKGVVGRALHTAETQLVPEVADDAEYVPLKPGTHSALAVPLRRGEQVLGVLDVEQDRPNAFEPEDVLLAELLAEAIALTLDNARLYAETRQHVSDLDALYTVSRMTGQSLAFEDVLVRALSSVLLSIGFDAGLISLVDPSDNELHLVAEHGLPSALVSALQESGLSGTLNCYVHVTGESLAISDLRAETSEELRKATAEIASYGLRAYVGIPLLHRDLSLGAMGLFAHRRRSFSTSQMALLEAIGRQVATAVANARLFEATVNERQRLLTLIESSRDGIVLVGMDKRMLVVNAQAVEFLHLPGEPTAWTDRRLEDALATLAGYSPSAVQAMSADLARIRAGDEPPGELDLEVPPRAVHWLNLPVLVGTQPLGRLLVFRDVTEEKLLAKMRDDLTHTMVHDLRNPLTGISVALQLLDSKLANVISPAQHRLFEIADHSTRRMIDLVNSILELTRLERGRIPLNLAPLSVADLVNETLRMQSPLAVAKNLQLENSMPSDLPLAWADAELVGRVLQNLVGNAVKFTPAGGVVRVTGGEGRGRTGGRAGGEAEPSPWLRVSVTDNGPGISPELQGRLFQRFVVGEQEGRGSGLGLAFCKLAVEAQEGEIWVDSEPGRGATFTFTLPIAREDSLTLYS